MLLDCTIGFGRNCWPPCPSVTGGPYSRSVSPRVFPRPGLAALLAMSEKLVAVAPVVDPNGMLPAEATLLEVVAAWF